MCWLSVGKNVNIKMKITDSVLKNLPLEINRINDTEITGFFARAGKLRGSHRKISFVMRYRVGGRKGIQREYKICNYGDMPVRDVRNLAFQLSARIAANEDIAATKKQQQNSALEQHNEEKLDKVLDEFIVYCKTHRKDPEPLRAIERDIRPMVGKEPLSNINKRLLVTKVLDPIVNRGSRVQANKTLSLLKQILDYGVDRGLLKENCLHGIKRKSVGGAEQPRDRYLSIDELKLVFKKLPSLGLSLQIYYCLKLMLLTGCRVNEVCRAKWDHIDFNANIWLIPSENVKAKKGQEKSHTIPLNEYITESLKEVKYQFEEYKSDYLLPSPSPSNDIGGNCIDKRSVARAINRKLSEFTINKWTPHDLRRTVQTHLAALGTDAIVVEKILNHELNGMLKVYNQYDYMKERKSALKNWSELLQREVFL